MTLIKEKSSPSVKTLPLAIPVLLLVITMILGLFLVRFLEKVGYENLREQSQNIINAMARGIENEMHAPQAAVQALAGSPWIFPALLDPSSETLANAHSVLDRYKDSLGFSVCYLLDLKGHAIASSNRNMPDSFVGKDYSFRPYFKEALGGKSSFYMAEGITSRERGFYAAHSVKDKQGTVIGVAVIKKNVQEAESVLASIKNLFFVSPDGVIFMSSAPGNIFKILGSVDKTKVHEFLDSKQFTMTSPEPLLQEPLRSDSRVLFQGEYCWVFQKAVGSPGWSIVLLAPLHSVFNYTVLGWVITVFMGAIILILAFWASWRITAQAILRESAELFRTAFQFSGIGMALVHPDGHWLRVNPSLCRITGYSEEELMEKTFQDITCPEDLETDLGFVERLLAGDIQNYQMEKRYFHKDGHRVWIHLTV